MYEEAAQAFSEVLKLDSSYAEAAQELLRVQIIQLMVCNKPDAVCHTVFT